MTSSSGHTMASGDHGSSSVVPVISAMVARIAERDPGADAVLSGAAAEDVAQPLARRLAPPGGDDDPLRRTGPAEVGQQRAKSVGEEIGALSTMKVKRH